MYMELFVLTVDSIDCCYNALLVSYICVFNYRNTVSMLVPRECH